MRYLTSNNKLIGILGIIFGLLCFVPLFSVDKSKLIIHDSNLFLVRYLMIIGFINAGVYFIVFAALNYIGVLVPYYSKSITKYEKAKNHLIGIVLSLPFWVSISATVFMMSESIMWKTLWSLALIYVVWLLFSSVQVLQKGRTEIG